MLLLLIYTHNIFTIQKVNAINAMPTTMLVVTYATYIFFTRAKSSWRLSIFAATTFILTVSPSE